MADEGVKFDTWVCFACATVISPKLNADSNFSLDIRCCCSMLRKSTCCAQVVPWGRWRTEWWHKKSRCCMTRSFSKLWVRSIVPLLPFLIEIPKGSFSGCRTSKDLYLTEAVTSFYVAHRSICHLSSNPLQMFKRVALLCKVCCALFTCTGSEDTPFLVCVHLQHVSHSWYRCLKCDE